MALYAISDLHLAFAENAKFLQSLAPQPDDWLALVGDIGETEDHLKLAFDLLGPRFRKLLWTPGNHELWTNTSDATEEHGEAKYQRLIELCRSYDVLTPEDDYPAVVYNGEAIYLCPIFTLYDYSFRPTHVPLSDALQWAADSGVYCTDEIRLSPSPYPSVIEWCQARCEYTTRRLDALRGARTVLLGHFPLRQDLVWLPKIPRFSIWCGTTHTTDWHSRYNAKVVVSGHLHIASTRYHDEVRFEEVSLGYPRQWQRYNSRLPFPRLILGD